MRALLALWPLLLAAQGRFAGFEQDLERVRADLHVPGMAVAVVESGRVVWQKEFGDVTRATRMPIASVTKTMTAALVMQLVDAHTLRLDEDLRRMLSHTSDGTPGTEFLYNSGIFNSLTPRIERAGGMRFGALLRTRVFRPLGMTHTTGNGNVSAASGVISTTGDLAKYAIALDGTHLVSRAGKARMWTAMKSANGETLPYGLGWFTQTYAGERIVWHYGQDRDCGSLLLKLPGRRMTLIMLSNSIAISDAPRLLDGNVARSPVALAFLRDVAHLDAPQMARDEQIDQALVAFYLGKREESARILREVLAAWPDLPESGELTLLGLLAQLQFPETERCATALLKAHPGLPPAWFFYGLYLEGAQRYREAATAFEQITQHQPPWHHWSVSAAGEELKKLK